jgi:hypothetical protein
MVYLVFSEKPAPFSRTNRLFPVENELFLTEYEPFSTENKSFPAGNELFLIKNGAVLTGTGLLRADLSL